jgi:non-ribosomal peptide synthetase component E (peptide arylation enzyme)
MTLSEAASEAATLASLQATCAAGDDVSCRVLAEQAAHAAPQLANLGVETWDDATTVLSNAAADTAAVFSVAFERIEEFGFLKSRHLIGEALPKDDDEAF